MKSKISLIILLFLLFVPFVCGRQNNNAVKDEINKSVDEAMKETKSEIDERLAAEINKIKEEIKKDFEIKSENLEFKNQTVNFWLGLLAIIIACFGIIMTIKSFFDKKELKDKFNTWFKEIDLKTKSILGEQRKILASAQRKVRGLGNEVKKDKDLVTEDLKTIKNQTNQVANDLMEIKAYVETAKEAERQSQINRHMTLALKYDSEKKYSESIQEYTKVLKLDKENVVAYGLKGSALYMIGKHEEAIKEYEKGIEIKNDVSVLYGLKGNALFSLHQYLQAISSYDEAIKFNKNDKFAYIGKGDSLFQLKEYEKALNEYNKALEIDNKDVSVHMKKSKVYNELNELNDAINECNIVHELDKNNLDAHYLKGLINIKMLNFLEALDCFNYLLNKEYNFAEGYSFRAAIYSELGQYAKALADIEKALQINKNNFLVYLNIAWVYYKQKDYIKAEGIFSKALELSENNENLATLHVLKSYMYIDMNYGNKALYEITEALKLDNKKLYYGTLFAANLINLNFDKALDALKKYIEGLKTIYIEKKYYDKYIEIMKRAEGDAALIVKQIKQVAESRNIIIK